MKKIYILLSVFVLFAALTGCQKDVSSVYLNFTELVLYPNESVTLTATVLPKGAKTDMLWVSSKPTCATVDASGKVTAVKAGTAEITVSANGVQAVCKVFVTTPVQKMVLADTDIMMPVGSTRNLKVTVTPANAANALVYSSSNPEYVTVNENGMLTAIKEGKADITVSANKGELRAICRVSVMDMEEGDYVDEYGINHGKGITIGNVTFAPVNCGFHEEDYPFGKLYQWGRMVGQGYSKDNALGKDDATTPDVLYESCPYGEEPEDDVHYLADWNETCGIWMANDEYGNLAFDGATSWNDLALKSQFTGNRGIGNPCPDGWRVPSQSDFYALPQGIGESLSENSTYRHINVDDIKYMPYGQSGRWFGENHKTATAADPQGCLFLPCGGSRTPSVESTGYCVNRQNIGEYWTATPDSKLDEGAYAWVLMFDSTRSYHTRWQYQRAYGLTIRCVKE